MSGLALVLPVRDDHAGLARVLGRLAALDCVEEVVIVDDASEAPLDAAALRAQAAPWAGRLRVLRQDRRRGAGAARNRGLDHVRAAHLLFLDADDVPTAELAALWRAVRTRGFDLCMFRHADSRAAALGSWAPILADADLWRQAGLTGRALSSVDRHARDHLAQTANYPWNKICRTAFLREAGIRCTETLVHNDIELHWRSLAEARSVLASDRVAVIHHVDTRGGRLTNLRGAARLCVFLPLDRVASRLLPDHVLAPAFLRFSSFLLDWVRGNLDPAFHDRFDRRAAHFLEHHLSPPLFERLSDDDPVLAAQCLCQIAQGRGLPEPECAA